MYFATANFKVREKYAQNVKKYLKYLMEWGAEIMKLNSSQVAEIKSDDRLPSEIAKDYPVSIPHIRNIQNGHAWADVAPKVRSCAHDNHVVLDQTQTLDGHKVEFWECHDCGKKLFYLEG